jgi:hypothetical protein
LKNDCKAAQVAGRNDVTVADCHHRSEAKVADTTVIGLSKQP